MKHIKCSTAVKYGVLITLIALLAITTAVSAQTPILNRVSPNRWTIDAVSQLNAGQDAGRAFTLTGNNFNAGTGVRFRAPDGFVLTLTAAQTAVTNQRQIRATVPRSTASAVVGAVYRRPILNVAGQGEFQVFGAGGTSAWVPITIQAPRPTLLTATPQQFNFRPPAGGASYSTLTLTGRNFVENANVRFRGPNGYTLDVPTVDNVVNLRPGVYGFVNAGANSQTITIFTWNGTSRNIGAGLPTGTAGAMIDDWNNGYLFPSNSPPGSYTVSVVNTPNQESNRRNVVLLETSNNPSLNPLAAIPAVWNAANNVLGFGAGTTVVTGGPFATGAQIWVRNITTNGVPNPANPLFIPFATTYVDSRTLTCPNVTAAVYGAQGSFVTDPYLYVVQPAPGGGQTPLMAVAN